MTTLVRSVILSKFSEVARPLGIDPVRMMRHVGLDQTCFSTPDARVPEEALAEVLETAALDGNCVPLGLLVGESWRLSDFGALSLLLQHQPSLRCSLEALRHYRHLLSDSVFIEVSEQGGVATVQCVLVTGRGHAGRQPTELALGVLLSLCRFHLGPQWTPRGVHFAHAAPPQSQGHRRILGTRLEFDAEFDGIVLGSQELDMPNPLGDVQMAGYARELLDRLPRHSETCLRDEVRRALHLLLPRGESSLERVAASLGTSARSMQRQLGVTGNSFQDLLNEVRGEHSLRMLEAGTYSVARMSELTGFAETSAFSRWFSRHFGVPPSKWKAPGSEAWP
jgi:AraC-like DNA-binding protein